MYEAICFPTDGAQRISSNQPGSTLLSVFFLIDPEPGSLSCPVCVMLLLGGLPPPSVPSLPSMVPGISNAMGLSEHLIETQNPSSCVLGAVGCGARMGFFCCAFYLKSGLGPALMTVLYE